MQAVHICNSCISEDGCVMQQKYAEAINSFVQWDGNKRVL